MKAKVFVCACLLAAAIGAGSVAGQSMMSSSSSAGDASSMSAPAAADTKVGAALRAAKSTGHKVLFTTLEAAEALAAQGPLVLFFAADGSAYSQRDMKDINVNGARLKDITVVFVNFDTDRAARRQLGVTAQDTFVQIDARGAKVAAWNGGGVEAILQRVVRS